MKNRSKGTERRPTWILLLALLAAASPSQGGIHVVASWSSGQTPVFGVQMDLHVVLVRPDFQTAPDGTELGASWTLEATSDILQYLDLEYTLLDSDKSIISTRSEEDIVSATVTVSRSEAGLPENLDFEILELTLVGTDNFEIQIKNSSIGTGHFSGCIDVPQGCDAEYQDPSRPSDWLIRDPVLDPNLVSITGTPSDIAILGVLTATGLLFVNGFETGDLSAWSSASP